MMKVVFELNTESMKAYKIITGGMMLLFASACNSFLDVVPDNRTVLDTPEAVNACNAQRQVLR